MRFENMSPAERMARRSKLMKEREKKAAILAEVKKRIGEIDEDLHCLEEVENLAILGKHKITPEELRKMILERERENKELLKTVNDTYGGVADE